MRGTEIREISPGDRHISAGSYNAMVRAVRAMLDMTFDESAFELRDTGSTRSLKLKKTLNRFPYQLYIEGAELKVRYSEWARNGVVTKVSDDGTDAAPTLGADGVAKVIYAQLNAAINDPAIMPDANAAGQTIVCAATMPADVTTHNRYVLLGYVTVASSKPTNIVQVWHGGYIDDTVAVPDADDNNASTRRRTLERNASVSAPGGHDWALQLYGVARLSSAQPYLPWFQGVNPVTGDLQWATVDGNKVTPASQSLEFRNLGETPALWQMQLWNFNDASSSAMAAGDFIEFRDVTGGAGGVPMQAYADAAALWTWIYANGEPGGGWPWETASAINHGDLAGLNDGTDDADHNWAWCNDQAGYDSTHTRNYCESAATDELYDYNDAAAGSRKLALDVLNRILYDDAATVKAAVDAGARTLLAADGTTIVAEWLSQKLFDSAGVKSINWDTRCLYDTDGTTVAADWAGLSLKGDWDCTGNFSLAVNKYFAVGSDQGITVYNAGDIVVPTGVTGGIVVSHILITPAADGAYCTGAKLTPVTGTDGSITIQAGIITAITAAT